MLKPGMDFEPFNGDTFNSEIDARPQESICRLQYMIAFLLEKNEQIRQELATKRSEEWT